MLCSRAESRSSGGPGRETRGPGRETRGRGERPGARGKSRGARGESQPCEERDASRGPPDTGRERRVSRGTKSSWRRRVHVTSGPDRYFTTPRAEPSVNVSSGAAPLPLSGGALWAHALLLLALLLFSVGLVGNLALMCLVWHSLQLKSAWNCVLAGLALWDFLVLFFCLPVVLFHLLTGTRLMGALSCSLVPFLEVSSMGVATFSLCALSIDRFHNPCTTILSKLSVVFVGALLLAAPELLLYRRVTLPPQDGQGYYSTQVGLKTPPLDVCLAEPTPELPLAVLSLLLTYQEARSWWVFGCYLCLPLLFTLSCDLVTRRVTSQQAPQPIGRQDGSSRSSSPSVTKKDEAGQRSVILALIGLYTVCTLPDAACAVALSYLPALPVGVAPVLRLIGQFLLFARCSATPLLALRFSKPLGGAFVHCCCCCCDECHTPNAPDTPTPSLATPSTLLAMPLSAVAPPLRDTPPEQQAALGTPC
uniref:G protein-coupled receptor 37 like 1a n=1 Tax=Neogobius melanostomus TaxID=47308 RepID=A0A8C6U650_9GOBI